MELNFNIPLSPRYPLDYMQSGSGVAAADGGTVLMCVRMICEQRFHGGSHLFFFCLALVLRFLINLNKAFAPKPGTPFRTSNQMVYVSALLELASQLKLRQQ